MKKIKKSCELLAPASNWDMIRAGVANGADAIYFGIDKFNARVRAKNFQLGDLPEIMRYLHKHDVRGYVTLNILMFESELVEAEQLIRACMKAGVDSLIVQDVGIVDIVRRISADFPIHGSTQMTVTSPEAVKFFEPWDLEVMVLGRENNMKQIKTIADSTDIPLEVFVHGALCVSYSGQCLTSEMWGGRSANRGECAQACRLPYDLHVDGKTHPLGDVAYVLSPKDLAALEIVPELIEAGVHTFKIEGRMKSPEYVANVTAKYRRAIDSYFEGTGHKPGKEEMRELEQSFSRGFTYGFLKGTNHKTLLDGTYPKSRGILVGQVLEVKGSHVICKIQSPIKRGDGIVFDRLRPQEKEEGGRIYDLYRNNEKVPGEVENGRIEIVLGRNDVNLKRIHIGDRIWKTNDPALDRQLQKTFAEDSKIDLQFPVNLEVSGSVGTPMKTVWTDLATGNSVTVESETPMEQAMKRPLDTPYLTEQLGRLGDTLFFMNEVENNLVGEVIVPVRVLNQMRRDASTQLQDLREKPRTYTMRESAVVKNDRPVGKHEPCQGELVALCRTIEQVEAACATEDCVRVTCDFEFLNQYKEAVEIARKYNKHIVLATPRIHMPGENGFLRTIERLKPDGILVRSLGALQFYTEEKVNIPLTGDYSLNIANSFAASAFLKKGIERFTPSYDLNNEQMFDLLRQVDTSCIELTVHQHIPMFHTEHCVYCTFLSEGTDFTNCGRPCEEHTISLEDRVGQRHPVRVDAGCRNTVYNAIEQSGAEYLPDFQRLGIAAYRIEFLEETGEQVTEVLRLYKEALEGERTGTSVWRSLKATNQLGVTRGQVAKEERTTRKL